MGTPCLRAYVHTYTLAHMYTCIYTHAYMYIHKKLYTHCAYIPNSIKAIRFGALNEHVREIDNYDNCKTARLIISET